MRIPHFFIVKNQKPMSENGENAKRKYDMLVS